MSLIRSLTVNHFKVKLHVELLSKALLKSTSLYDKKKQFQFKINIDMNNSSINLSRIYLITLSFIYTRSTKQRSTNSNAQRQS